MVDDEKVDHLISWNFENEGTSFIVWKPLEFARDLLPMYFRHSNFKSFRRQLLNYVRETPLINLLLFIRLFSIIDELFDVLSQGFEKMDKRLEFFNIFFMRGKRNLLTEIQRKPPQKLVIPAQPVAATVLSPLQREQERGESSQQGVSGAMEENQEGVMEENKRLRREVQWLRDLLKEVIQVASKPDLGGRGSLAKGKMPAVEESDDED